MSNLAARIEALTEPSREVDALIPEALGLGRMLNDRKGPFYEPGPMPEGWPRICELPDYTASLDAVIRLVAEQLPGWGWAVGRPSEGSPAKAWAILQPGDMRHEDFPPEKTAATPALALLAALMRAMAELKP